MGKRWYGSLDNRIEENQMFCRSIEVGTGVTEYHYSDRTPYEVTKVIDQKHVFIRQYKAIGVGEPMSNTWALFSDPNNPEIEIKFRYNYWYQVLGKDKTGKTRYERMNLSFGRAEKYYDYSF